MSFRINSFDDSSLYFEAIFRFRERIRAFTVDEFEKSLAAARRVCGTSGKDVKLPIALTWFNFTSYLQGDGKDV